MEAKHPRRRFRLLYLRLWRWHLYPLLRRILQQLRTRKRALSMLASRLGLRR